MADDDDQAEQFPALIPVRKPLSLIPVSLKEAALDSPPFRATVVHLSDQFEGVERWLDAYVRAASKLAQEIAVLEGLVGSFLSASTPPTHLSEAVLDHDYTLLALKRFGEGAREYWSHTLDGIKKTQNSVINPIRNFLDGDVKVFKTIRTRLEANQKNYDTALARYYSQVKSKEPSSLREDAFQLHEAKRAYLRSSMDFCVQTPQVHASLDDLLINVFSDQWLEMKGLRETSTNAFQRYGQEISRIRGWNKEMFQSDRVLKRELIMARVQIEDQAEAACRPSRDLDDYAASTVPFLGNRPPSHQNETNADTPTSKQGWLYLRTLTGKPARSQWIRRWFYVKNGIFGWMVLGSRSGGVEESEKIGVLLCSVRPAFQEERRFCFEVKTKDAAMMLQAESQGDLTEWMSIFDVAKQKAIEDPASTEAMASSNNQSVDPAFAVSPAIAPELAAKEDVASMFHSAEGLETQAVSAPRQNVDTAALRRNSNRMDVGDSGRDHGARFIQRLDLHKKSNAGTQISSGGPSPSSSSFGIASLISASHSAMPVGPGRVTSLQRKPVASEQTTLAPLHLVQPPAPTNLSSTAVAIGAERGLDLGVVDSSGGVPSSIMANQWGTTNYGHLSRVERGEVKTATLREVSIPVMPQRRLSDPSSNTEPAEETSFPELTPTNTESTIAPSVRRKPVGEQQPSPMHRRAIGSLVEYPSFYPPTLKAHDTQMRMLFPNISHDERAVLVFRASWNPDDRQDLPGRVFVTLRGLYFYSHHYGFTLVSGIQLSRVLDVSIARQGQFDLLYLHVEGESEREESQTIVIKTFLDLVQVLHRRLKFLVSNCSAEEPASLEEALKILIDLDSESFDGSGDYDEDDDLSPLRQESRGRTGTVSGPSVRVDRTLYGGDGAPPDANDVLRFRLPTQAIKYSPKGMSEIAVQGDFDISAKALFHIIFGDKSVLSQMLYCERRASSVKQYPWKAFENNRWARHFEYEASINGVKPTTLTDSQTVDIANDHLCYVVTDTKTPWHLPYPRNFTLVSKVVITHMAKSKCLLRIYTAVDWSLQPKVFKDLVERHAMDDLRLDAQDLFGLVSDQVQKLGPNTYTKKAIQIFGQLGQQTEAAQIPATDVSHLISPSRLIVRKHTLTSLIFNACTQLVTGAIANITAIIMGAFVSFFQFLSGHSILTALLLTSAALNLFSTSEVASAWWHERSAIRLIGNLGVGPNVALSKSIQLADIDRLISYEPDALIRSPAPSPSSPGTFTSSYNTDRNTTACASNFLTILSSSSVDDPTALASSSPLHTSNPSTTRRLARTRQRMGTYRHDLLVALRLINRVEQEVVRTEYETFVRGETGRCREVGRLLGSSEQGQSGGSPSGRNGKAQREARDAEERLGGAKARERVKVWYGRYCESCYDEMRGIGR